MTALGRNRNSKRVPTLATASVVLALGFCIALLIPPGARAQVLLPHDLPSGRGADPRFAATLPPVDSARAFQDLQVQVSFGPRPAGSEALAKTRAWIIVRMKQAGVNVEEDSFRADTPIGPINMTNLIVKVPGESPQIVLVTGHYDTKRFDQFRFVGANDGASSGALVMELARTVSRRPMPYTTWFVLFDGEEAVREQWQGNDNDYGSRHMVQKLIDEGLLNRVKAMILVDMIGDAKLDIQHDPNSTPWLTELEFSTARKLGYDKYFLRSSFAVGGDDYDPFLAAGVPAVDVIDFDYGPGGRWWHSPEDTAEHCSPLSLEVVGRVVLGMLQELAGSPHLRP